MELKPHPSVTLTSYCLYTQAFGIGDSGFDTCVTIYKMEKITPPPFYSPLLNDKELNYTKEWHFNNSFSRQSQELEMTKKMGGFPALQAFLARHYIGKKSQERK